MVTCQQTLDLNSAKLSPASPGPSDRMVQVFVVSLCYERAIGRNTCDNSFSAPRNEIRLRQEQKTTIKRSNNSVHCMQTLVMRIYVLLDFFMKQQTSSKTGQITRSGTGSQQAEQCVSLCCYRPALEPDLHLHTYVELAADSLTPAVAT